MVLSHVCARKHSLIDRCAHVYVCALPILRSKRPSDTLSVTYIHTLRHCHVFKSVTWRIHTHVVHQTFKAAEQHKHMRTRAHTRTHSLTLSRIDMCDVTHAHVRRNAFVRATWLVHTCDVTHSYVWRDAFIRATRRIHTCDMTHSYM